MPKSRTPWAPVTAQTKQQDDDTANLDEPKVVAMKIHGQFDHLDIWAHDSKPDDLVDPDIRGLDEWILLAEKVGLTFLNLRICADINR